MSLLRVFIFLLVISLSPLNSDFARADLLNERSNNPDSVYAKVSWQQKLVKAARERTRHFVVYQGDYRAIDYPMGDVPDNIGVCTDVVIRSYRKSGLDLQVLVHEDMKRSFHLYPKNWGLKTTDRNIDHRRVPNLQVFFSRFGQSIPVTSNARDYQAGDLVTWMLPGNLPHIGIVSDKVSNDGKRLLIIHNIGWGPREDDYLFSAKITGHYRFSGNNI